MILIVAILIGVVDRSLAVPSSNHLTKRYCDNLSSLALVYALNEKSVEYNSFEEVNNLLRINFNNNLGREDFLVWLGDKCRSRSLTLEWFLHQAEIVCPNAHKIRSLIEPSGVVCHQDGGVTELTKKALQSFVRVNKSYNCEIALTSIQSQCEIVALFNVAVPMAYNKQSLETQINVQTRRTLAAIRCTLSKLGRLTPRCGRVRDLQRYQLVTELIQKQPFKLRGEVDFENFADVMI
ncbi:uncharacterized protein LOC117338170 [Pecten maximus]|uniref:uncharacterized protein LOC117338170 n=1 Tax=Pecten maximus TaxID=6579 RepID=UPI001458A4EF|nr:uncharacterized protein LOC117338170 [Pecten maximus]